MDDFLTPPPSLENHHDAIFGNRAKRIPGIYPMLEELKLDIKTIKGTLEQADDVKKAAENTAKGRGQAVGFVGKVIVWAGTITGLLSGIYALVAYIRGT